MHKIDMDDWARREHFEFFRTWDYPHFNMCGNVDITAFLPVVKARNSTITVGLIYLLTRAANSIREFRHRIRGESVVEHPVVHPACTILMKDDSFSFCYFDYMDDFGRFSKSAAERIANVRENPSLQERTSDHWLYMTSIPWVSFTSFMHPMQLSPADSVPRFAWGKYFNAGDRLLLPLSVQGHHAVMDGLHIGRYYEKVQAMLDRPDLGPGGLIDD